MKIRFKLSVFSPISEEEEAFWKLILGPELKVRAFASHSADPRFVPQHLNPCIETLVGYLGFLNTTGSYSHRPCFTPK